MSQEAAPLQAQLRQRTGKGAARELRRNSMVPAVIYGEKKEPLAIALPYKELSMRLHGGGFMTTIAMIEIDGETHRVLPKDYQLDPVRDFVEHVDFLRVGRNTIVTVAIPVVIINEEQSPGIERGGVVNMVRHEIEVNCPADSIPDSIEVDLTGLEINEGVHISSVNLPEGVTPAITDRDFTIATVAAPAALLSEEEEAAEAEEGVETAIIGEEGEGDEDGEEASESGDEETKE